jgi:magnesium-transporting ATPase (P-type)
VSEGAALVIDGAALALALAPAHEAAFLELCKACAGVVCCRVSPMQKAQASFRFLVGGVWCLGFRIWGEGL